MGPFAALALAGTVANGVGGIFGASAAQREKEDANNLRNQLAIRKYNDTIAAQDFEWAQTLNVWNAKLADYDRTTAAINKGLVNAYKGVALDLKESYTAAAFKMQEQFVNEMVALGKIGARTTKGATSGRIASAKKGSYGRNTAILNESLKAKGAQANVLNQKYADQAQGAINKAYSAVSVAPIPPPRPSAPMLTPAPGRGGMWASILGSVGGMATSIAGMDFGGGSSLPGGDNRSSLAIGDTNWGGMNTDFYSGGFGVSNLLGAP